MDSSNKEKFPSGASPTSREADMAGWNKPLPEKLPRPTYWPFAFSLGVMMMAMGVVTSLVVSGVGFLLLLVALAGWIGEFQHGEE